MAEPVPNVIPMPNPRNVRLACVECGANAIGNCQCGQPYLPPGLRALHAVIKQPMLTNTLIAAKLGVDEKTVRRARKAAGSAYAEGARKGLDGKVYKARRKMKHKPRTHEPRDHINAFCRELSNFVGDFTIELVRWLETAPQMDTDGRLALAHNLEAYSMQLQRLSQRVVEGGDGHE